MLNDDGQAVLMDLGSANKARVEIKTRSEAQALQVNSDSVVEWFCGRTFENVEYTIGKRVRLSAKQQKKMVKHCWYLRISSSYSAGFVCDLWVKCHGPSVSFFIQ